MTPQLSIQSICRSSRIHTSGPSRTKNRRQVIAITLAASTAAAALFSGCQTSRVKVASEPLIPIRDCAPIAVTSGDVVKLSFAGMPEFDQTQKIRADGRISLPLIGEYRADGKTPSSLQRELSCAYQKQLQNSNIVVTLENTSATAYVTGAVAKPSKVVIDRPMTVFEAIMEAGGFQPDFANPRKVLVLRNENGVQTSRVLDLSGAFKGKPFSSYQVKPRDVIYVPQSLF